MSAHLCLCIACASAIYSYANESTFSTCKPLTSLRYMVIYRYIVHISIWLAASLRQTMSRRRHTQEHTHTATWFVIYLAPNCQCAVESERYRSKHNSVHVLCVSHCTLRIGYSRVACNHLDARVAPGSTDIYINIYIYRIYRSIEIHVMVDWCFFFARLMRGPRNFGCPRDDDETRALAVASRRARASSRAASCKYSCKSTTPS